MGPRLEISAPEFPEQQNLLLGLRDPLEPDPAVFSKLTSSFSPAWRFHLSLIFSVVELFYFSAAALP